MIRNLRTPLGLVKLTITNEIATDFDGLHAIRKMLEEFLNFRNYRNINHLVFGLEFLKINQY